MKINNLFRVFMAIITLMIASGCSTENNSVQDQENPAKPQPQVRIMLLPSETAAPTQTNQNTSTPEASPTAAIVQAYIEPTPDVDAIANQIEALMDEIDRKLRNENFQLKP